MLVLFISIVVSFLISQTYMDIHNEDDTKQLVLYNPPEFIKPFHEKTRTFLVCQHEWKLAQDWHHSGVAGVVWEAAIVLSKFLENNSYLVTEKQVIELGAGTGFVGMVAAALGAKSVSITDKNIEITKENIQLNHPLLSEVNANISVASYEWGQPIPSSLSPPYDLILGSDIIYIEEIYEFLIWSLKALSNNCTTVLLASKLRYDKVENFLKILNRDFMYTMVSKDGDVHIYKIQPTNIDMRKN